MNLMKKSIAIIFLNNKKTFDFLYDNYVNIPIQPVNVKISLEGAFEMTEKNLVARTVLGPVNVEDLGRVLMQNTLLSIYPGAELAPDVQIDRSDIFESLKEQLFEIRKLGFSTIVENSGMFHGRDPWMYETLSRITGVHIITSTGLGPEKMLSGYFTTPQSNPPTPWPAAKFAGLFIKEIEEGMVVPRVERAGFPGLVTSIADVAGMTEIEENLFKGCAQTALQTGVPISVQTSVNAAEDLDVLIDQGVAASHILIGGLDRKDRSFETILAVAEKGAYIGIDHIGWGGVDGYKTDVERVDIIRALLHAGYGEQLILGAHAVGVAKGHQPKELDYTSIWTQFVPRLREAGVTEQQLTQLFETNPQQLLATDASKYTIATNETSWKDIFSPVLF